MADLSRAAWRKSSHSTEQGTCVEVALNLADVAAVRDSKNPQGAALSFSADHFATFVARIKTGEMAR